MAPKALSALKTDTNSRRATPMGAAGLGGTTSLDGSVSPSKFSTPSVSFPPSHGPAGPLSPPILRTPNMKKGSSQPGTTTPIDVCVALKKELLAVQSIMDTHASLRPTYAMRQLETEIFRIDAIPALDDRLAALFCLLSKKLAEATQQQQQGNVTLGEGSPSLKDVTSSRSYDDFPFTSGAAVAAALSPPSISFVRNAIAVSQKLDAMQQQQQQQRQTPPSPQPARTTPPAMASSLDPKGTTNGPNRQPGAAASLNNSMEPLAVLDDVPPMEGTSPSQDGTGSLRRKPAPLEVGGVTPAAPGTITKNSSNPVSIAAPYSPPSPGSMTTPVKPVSADTRQLLVNLGVIDSHADPSAGSSTDQPLDLDHVLKKLVAAARGLQNTRQQLDAKMKVSNEVNSSAYQRLLVETETLRLKLTKREQEYSELKQHVAGTRFAPNAMRSLTTVHDAPMSYEVERGYQKELKFANDRIQELEDALSKLREDGQCDRDRVVALTAQLDEKDVEIRRLEGVIRSVEQDRDEQRQLFVGVSRTREEESRMSLVAVKQLESRVSSLSERLSQKINECSNVTDSLKQLYSIWSMAEERNKTLKEELRVLDMTSKAYESVYNSSLTDELFIVQHDLVQALSLADTREATVMIQKQQLDDVDVLRHLSATEAQLWVEKLKSSAEWKLLSTKVPEETKQLAVRILILTGDKEKKEASMVASQQERLSLFKARAENEIATRLKRHEERVQMLPPSAHQDKLQLLLEAAAEQREREDSEHEEARLPPKLAAMEEYMQEAKERSTDPRVFFGQWLEKMAAQQQQLRQSLGR